MSIPDEVRVALSRSLSPRGVEQAWEAKWRLLGGRMCDVWAAGRHDDVLAAIEAYNTGSYL